ncbi:hypothetical protein SAY87_008215 [Trapa incisa]|uniref:C2H2-type domain-containing protein n=1 Tax=Trapa incisa TaxID=236973 RepID=A0AAN7KCV9_9MYRT|nr:hypothetical protein SAY87_008215 [Trapa incisa]
MSVSKSSTSNSTDILKLEGNDVVDTWFKQSIVNDPLISLMKASDRPIQWIRFHQALDQPDLPGWPLLSPVKVQLHKCDKCSRKFFSSINCRRHIRVHHRLKKLDKDTGKSRELLGSFWNKLSAEEKKEIVSFKDLTFEGVHGSTIIKNLSALILRTGLSPLPQTADRAGASLLDIIQARPSTFPLSSEELFRVLDDASEMTFLSGSAFSMQKYIFDGEAVKLVMEAKNLVACTSFFLELLLIKAWIVNKDVEALRCQKLLVEEEEAEHRRQTERLEKRRQKRFKQKTRDNRVELERDYWPEKIDSPKAGFSVEASDTVDILASEALYFDKTADQVPSSTETWEHQQDEEAGFKAQKELGFNHTQAGMSQQQLFEEDGYQKLSNGKWKMTPRLHGSYHGFCGGNYHRASRADVIQSHEINNSIGAPTVNISKVKNWKPKPENNEIVNYKVLDEGFSQDVPSKKHEVLIGSIPVKIESFNDLQVHELEGCDGDEPMAEYILSITNISDEICKDKNIQSLSNTEPQQSQEKTDVCQNLAVESCLPSSATGNDISLLEVEAKRSEDLLFSIGIARDFLAQRWKEAISGDHVKLGLLQDSEPEGLGEAENYPQEVSDVKKVSVVGSAQENPIAEGFAVTSICSGNRKASFPEKLEEGVKKIYMSRLAAA